MILWLWVTVPLLLLLLVASWTDVTNEKTIYNWNTYPGILLGLVINLGLDLYFGREFAGFKNAILGFLACGGIMLFCFVLFSGLGGGDLKMIAMMGSFLGIYEGIEAMLWTFVLGAVMGIGVVIWEHGFLNLLSRATHHLKLVFRSGGWVALSDKDEQVTKKVLFLGPSALLAVIIVQGRQLQHLL